MAVAETVRPACCPVSVANQCCVRECNNFASHTKIGSRHFRRGWHNATIILILGGQIWCRRAGKAHHTSTNTTAKGQNARVIQPAAGWGLAVRLIHGRSCLARR
ncbi:uncharacterized protein PV06_02280 [Exophiala oligosperma]|uniref:Uncharacterized protein n=1 Tax=Exophiala oligosperma TaxID=215243 RepID=A0A0D2DTX6_9EURO|nr:uncharacterized protein PV06_02280 [Exophiala oligosperma]KIW46618.1 hypothetical protein PV06_02280 [Exophiala oligosperma]